jgi:simple sugar transport system substrate-binding protein
MWRRTAILATAAALLLSGCTDSAEDPKSQGATGTGAAVTALSEGVAGKKVTFIIYAPQATPFFAPVVKGAKDAAAAYGLNLQIQYSNSDVATQNNQIQTAVAGGTEGLAVSIASDDAFTKSLCDAKAKNIPIVAFNVTASGGPVLDCVLSFVGQDFVAAGELIAQRMIDDGKVQRGDTVFCPVEDPSAVYAIQRAEGANRALAKVGAKCDLVGTGFDLAKAQTTAQQYLIGRRSTKAILGLGLVPLQVAPAAAKQAGVEVAIGGFDLSPEISAAIKAGSITATVEQQPYLQGYFAVEQLAMNLKYGLTPSDIDTGNALVDKSNIEKVAALAGTVY